MSRARYILKVIRFEKQDGSAIYTRHVTETQIRSKTGLIAAIKDARNDDRLWISVTRDDEKCGALWAAITGNHSWITYWADGKSIDTHAFNRDRTDAEKYIEFLLDNTQPQMVRESFTFERKTALDSLGYFVVHGVPPTRLEFTDVLDTYC